jgi:DNA-binding transcriptional ArsR family regulator
MRRDVFQAIADPTRRTILTSIARQLLNVNAVAAQFDVSRTAIYKHMKILTECGLMEIRQEGRERFCEADFRKLAEVSDWIEQYREFWDAKLDSLQTYLDELQADKGSHKKKKKHGKKKRKH